MGDRISSLGGNLTVYVRFRVVQNLDASTNCVRFYDPSLLAEPVAFADSERNSARSTWKAIKTSAVCEGSGARG